MGSTSYSSEDRTIRAHSSGFYTKSVDQIFEQNIKRMIHESMDPKNIKIREARDSAVHPNTIPIIVSLDVTGSMGHIPHHLVKDGLPHMMGGIIQKGIPDPALLFLAVGDTECDRYPLQVGQFESGDEELDTWLTRTYLEGGGGGNQGESYLLSWYFAANHTVTDAWEKRGKKGFLFTIGDEPCLPRIPMNHIKNLMDHGVGQSGYSDAELLAAAREKWDVYHLHVTHSEGARRSLGYWKELMGQSCIEVPNYEDVPKIISEIVVKGSESSVATTTTPSTEVDNENEDNSPSADPKITL